jgi:hypothetical protein
LNPIANELNQRSNPTSSSATVPADAVSASPPEAAHLLTSGNNFGENQMVRPERFSPGTNARRRSMSEIDAQETFRYRKIAAQEDYRIYENRGRCWLLAYLVPFGLVVGSYVSWQIGHGWIHQHVCATDAAYGVIALAAAAGAASGFGLASLFRAEFHADRAFQPLVCGCLTLLYLLVWWKTQ